MISITAGNNEFRLYGSIKELPMHRHKLMQQYLLQDSGIGSTIEDIDNRFSKLFSLMEADKKQETREELFNMRYAFFSALHGLDYKCRAFACFIESVNGKPVDDTTSEGMSQLVDQFRNLSVEEFEAHWERLKKKLIPNSEPISPDGLEMTWNSLKIYENGIS